jgi:oxygen-independent coproporphyrinogen-3 oxidase
MERLPKKTQIEELLLMGLRLTDGLDRRRFMENTGLKIEEAVSRKALTALRNIGLIELDANGLRVTKNGLLKLNSVISKLLL